MKKVKTKVISQTEIADDVYDMWIESDLANTAKAGQFISVYPHNESTLLPRPISICEVDGPGNRLRIVYRVAGKGTKELSLYHTGRNIRILGNLGNGFPLEEAEGKRVVLMGGGIGIPPMLQLAKELRKEGKAKEITMVAGYRNHQLFLKADMEKYASVYVATEDGSEGTKGNVLDAMAVNHLEADVIMACGPMPMLRAIKRYAGEKGIKAYISLEERMACGVGACLGCVCKTKEKDWHSHVNNTRICTEGPVFDAQDVDI
ncbi:dihydroorotate dehydrogenase electron transfer subunit [Kineothrix sp. MB12-C1]|uniref:dihydroorotate dehydrogenase electron transfer subunit n=1 Tax=Kineothrix sp. MB12-C1 TaxID=3070215 RepID=UPI0027D1FFC3|nr:dihydroorotate dehydrogenase electron transfer subunit [Kineothrix sp. MB12-C1]WMC94041.1 dihydroorotate dehydrogenase electron transfer subunit [Kineothrix sp. MB12-C1]